jgi:hypothetical protein
MQSDRLHIILKLCASRISKIHLCLAYLKRRISSEIKQEIDGNVYQTVTIGNQGWMKENLRVTHYRNRDAIPQVTIEA